eukprot:TRINITY_DN8954_c0_g1_i1.p1 TRINITY_DN8954_c0_g1~~TRINITY_DN8954_c0_g1_i1.p1  ORF type:complete len:292 (+),score=30.24 TRINITY_DN8954_c0_g1_i1:2-877(+)
MASSKRRKASTTSDDDDSDSYMLSKKELELKAKMEDLDRKIKSVKAGEGKALLLERKRLKRQYTTEHDALERAFQARIDVLNQVEADALKVLNDEAAAVEAALQSEMVREFHLELERTQNEHGCGITQDQPQMTAAVTRKKLRRRGQEENNASESTISTPQTTASKVAKYLTLYGDDEAIAKDIAKLSKGQRGRKSRHSTVSKPLPYANYSVIFENEGDRLYIKDRWYYRGDRVQVDFPYSTTQDRVIGQILVVNPVTVRAMKVLVVCTTAYAHNLSVSPDPCDIEHSPLL